MELTEISSTFFSQWVESSSSDTKLHREDSKTSKGSRKISRSRKTSRQDSRTSVSKLYLPKAKYSEGDFKEALQIWIQLPEHEETMQLKKLVRQGVLPKLRSELWKDSSGGSDIIFNSPHYYEEMIDDMGKLLVIFIIKSQNYCVTAKMNDYEQGQRTEPTVTKEASLKSQWKM